MIENNNHNPFQYLNRMERFGLLLTDVRYCFLGKVHRMSREKITLMLEDIVHDEHLFYMIFFMGAYYAVKKEHRNEKEREESIEGMEDLMGWEKQSVRDKVTSVYESKFSIDNLTKEKEADTPNEAFAALMKLFYEKRESINNFIHKRPFYKEILDPFPHVTLYVCILLEEVGDFFRSNINQFNWDQMSDIMEDIIEILLEWISIVAGLTYYHLKYNLGTEEQVSDLLDVLKDLNGYEKHKKSGEVEDYSPSVSRLGRSAEKPTLRQIELELDWGCPSVISYADEDSRNELQNAEDLVIEDEKIKILFQYPLSTEVLLEFEKAGGFKRMDIFRCIYKGYKKIYDEEERDSEVSDSISLNRGNSNGPYGIWGHDMGDLFIERVNYNPDTKIISMFIGS